jgi:hypothetical protein
MMWLLVLQAFIAGFGIGATTIILLDVFVLDES